MTTPVPLRHVREIVGAFVLAVLALVLLSLLFVGRGRHWFDSRGLLTVTFPAEQAAALRPGVAVRLAGEAVGRVSETVRESSLIRARLDLLRSAREVLRSDARARLRVPIAGLLGELGIDLDAGSESAPWPDGRVMTGEAEGDPALKASQTMARLGEQVPAMLARTQAILDKTDALLGQVQRANTPAHADQLIQSLDRVARALDREQTAAHATRALGELEGLLGDLRRGRGSAGKLFTDDAAYDRATAVLGDLHASWGKLDALMGAGAKVAERAGQLADEAHRRGRDLEALLAEVQLLVLQANRTLEQLNEHWLLRGTVPEPGLPAPPGVLDLPLEPAPGPAGGGLP